MFLLDTKVISELRMERKDRSQGKVLARLDGDQRLAPFIAEPGSSSS